MRLALSIALFSLAACDDATAPTPSPLLSAPQRDAAPVEATDASVTPLADASKPDAPSTTCALKVSTSNATCDQCLTGACCDVTNACLGDAECSSLVDCMSGCAPTDGGAGDDGGGGDKPGCGLQCFKLHPTAVSAFANFDGCARMSCASCF
jgi:hypothetical protein